MYNPTLWKDHILAKPRTYNMITNEDGTRTLDDVPENVIQKGTPLSSNNMNHIENGIVSLDSDTQNLRDAIRTVATDGVKEFGNNLHVYAGVSGISVRVRSGAAMVQGYPFSLADEVSLEFDAPEANPRIDRVVVRLDMTAIPYHFSLSIRKGTAEASPAAPALVRNEAIYEISLARVTVYAGAISISDSDIKDERYDESVCGAITIGVLHPSAFKGIDDPIIINRDFLSWQRGESFTLTGASQYTADRWSCSGNGTVISKAGSNGGIRVVASADVINLYLRQLNPRGYEFFIGQTITAKISVDGVIYTRTFQISTGNCFGFDLVTMIWAATATGSGALVQIKKTSAVAINKVINWVELRWGGMDFEHQPQLEHKALEDCRAYVLATGAAGVYNRMMISTYTGYIRIHIPLTVTMRTTPVIEKLVVNAIRVNGTIITPPSFSSQTVVLRAGMIWITLNHSASIPESQVGYADVEYILSAD